MRASNLNVSEQWGSIKIPFRKKFGARLDGPSLKSQLKIQKNLFCHNEMQIYAPEESGARQFTYVIVILVTFKYFGD